MSPKRKKQTFVCAVILILVAANLFLCAQFSRYNPLTRILTARPERFNAERALKGSKYLNRKAVDRITASARPYPFHFAVIGDPHVGGPFNAEETFTALLSKIVQDKPAFLVVNGDFVDSASDENYARYLQIIEALPFPVITVMGNHDISPREGLYYYARNFGDPDFLFDYGDFRFVFASFIPFSTDPGTNDKMSFLRDSLKTNRYPFLFRHVPPFKALYRRADDYKLDLYYHYNGNFFGSAKEYPDRFEEFFSILKEHQPLTFFASHMHCFADYSLESMRFVVTGGGGAVLNEEWQKTAVAPHDGVFHHYVKITLIGKNSYVGEVVRPTGADESYRFSTENGTPSEKE